MLNEYFEDIGIDLFEISMIDLSNQKQFIQVRKEIVKVGFKPSSKSRITLFVN